MISAIIHHLMSNEYGPFDRFVEMGVFGLIAYEIGLSLWYKHQTRKYIAALHGQMRRGLDLQTKAPTVGMGDTDPVREWIKAVPSWVDETNKLLSGYSAQASASFLHKPEGQRHGLERQYANIYTGARLEYAELVERINSLRAIMEKPDVYL